jgi:hypothetical protein
VLRDGEAGWSLPGGLATVAVGVPENLRQLLAWYLEQLPTVEQTLLEAASVAGREFAVAAVAAAMDWTVEDVEGRCAALARRGQFLQVCGMDAWPDGTITTRYGFIHDVYRETLYEQVPCGRRARYPGVTQFAESDLQSVGIKQVPHRLCSAVPPTLSSPA